MFLFPPIKLEEINLITLWSEKPCLFDVTLSDYSHRLKNDFISINSCLRDHSFLFSRLSERFLERFSCKIMAAANNFFSLRCRHFVCLHRFIRWKLRSKLKSHIVAGEKNRQVVSVAICGEKREKKKKERKKKIASDFRRRSNSPWSAYKTARCIVGLRCISKANVLCFSKDWIKFA